MTFHLCVHIKFSSVWVAEWPPFGEKLLTVVHSVDHMFSLYFLLFVILRAGSEF